MQCECAFVWFELSKGQHGPSKEEGGGGAGMERGDHRLGRGGVFWEGNLAVQLWRVCEWHKVPNKSKVSTYLH